MAVWGPSARRPLPWNPQGKNKKAPSGENRRCDGGRWKRPRVDIFAYCGQRQFVVSKVCCYPNPAVNHPRLTAVNAQGQLSREMLGKKGSV